MTVPSLVTRSRGSSLARTQALPASSVGVAAKLTDTRRSRCATARVEDQAHQRTDSDLGLAGEVR